MEVQVLFSAPKIDVFTFISKRQRFVTGKSQSPKKAQPRLRFLCLFADLVASRYLKPYGTTTYSAYAPLAGDYAEPTAGSAFPLRVRCEVLHRQRDQDSGLREIVPIQRNDDRDDEHDGRHQVACCVLLRASMR